MGHATGCVAGHGVRRHQLIIAQIQAYVHDSLTVLSGEMFGVGCLSETHHFQRAAQYLLVKREGGARLAVEGEVWGDFHALSPVWLLGELRAQTFFLLTQFGGEFGTEVFGFKDLTDLYFRIAYGR